MSIYPKKYQHEKEEGSIGETARMFAEKVNYHLDLGKTKVEGCQLAFEDYKSAFKHSGITPNKCIYLTAFCREYNRDKDNSDDHISPKMFMEDILNNIEGDAGLFVYLITLIGCREDASLVQQIFKDSQVISEIIVDTQNEVFGEDRTGFELQTFFSLKMQY